MVELCHDITQLRDKKDLRRTKFTSSLDSTPFEVADDSPYLALFVVPPYSYDTTCETSCGHCSSDETVREWFVYNKEGDTVGYDICDANCGAIKCEEDDYGRLCTCGECPDGVRGETLVP